MESNEMDFNQGALQEEYLKPLENIEEGKLVEGTVVQVDKDFIYLDVFCKSEGKVPTSEFDEIPKLDDKVTVLLIKKEGRNAEPVISKKKADIKGAWKDVRDAWQDKKPVSGKIIKAIKGGFEVELGIDSRAFLPISQTDTIKVETPEDYIGLKGEFLIERLYSDRKVNIVVTRRSLLEEQTKQKREEFFANTQVGDEVTGSVKSFTSFGAFVDLGGFDGLLHINDMSWGHVTRPKDWVKKNQEIKLKVINLDTEKQKINLSLKHFTDDPWDSFHERYDVDQRIKGQVTKLTDFGVFIEIEEGIEGLAHISELSWIKKVKHPKELFKIGDEVEALILGYDLDARRVSLGIKQVLPNPWEEIESKYTPGMKLKRVIKKITHAGAFIELEEGIDGFLHIDDLSWTQRGSALKNELVEGEEIEVALVSVDPHERRIRLGVKQLTDDPWEALKDAAPRRSIIEGTVSSITDFGVFVKVSEGIEGLVYKNQLTEDREADFDEALKQFNEGDKVKAVVMDINPHKQKLSLSIKELAIQEQRQEMSKYLHAEEDENTGGDSTFTLGDALKNKND